jgi:hypothetical protein
MASYHIDMGKRQVELLEDLLYSLQATNLECLQIRVGIFKDTWHAEFGEEELPHVVSLIIETILKKATYSR